MGRVLHREEWAGGLSLARVGQPFFTHRPSAATRPRPAQSVHLPCQPTTVLAGPGIVCCGRVCVAGRGVRPLDQFLRRVLALQNVACRCRHAIRPSPRGQGNEGGREEGRARFCRCPSFVRSIVRSQNRRYLPSPLILSLALHSTLTFRTRGGGRRRRRGGEALTAVGPAAAAAQRQGVSWHFVRRIPFHTNPGDTLLRGPGGRRRDGECSYSFRGIGRRDRGWRGRCGRGKRTTD